MPSSRAVLVVALVLGLAGSVAVAATERRAPAGEQVVFSFGDAGNAYAYRDRAGRLCLGRTGGDLPAVARCPGPYERGATARWVEHRQGKASEVLGWVPREAESVVLIYAQRTGQEGFATVSVQDVERLGTEERPFWQRFDEGRLLSVRAYDVRGRLLPEPRDGTHPMDARDPCRTQPQRRQPLPDNELGIPDRFVVDDALGLTTIPCSGPVP